MPWQAVRVLAGYRTDVHSVHLPRDLLEPPQCLQEKIFPLLDQSIREMEQSDDNKAGKAFWKC